MGEKLALTVQVTVVEEFPAWIFSEADVSPEDAAKWQALEAELDAAWKGPVG
jgi:hypothetical protein